MKRNPRNGAKSLFWLFQKRLFHETRKYTAGIILTAGITALFVSMLVIGSSFLSSSYRATGTNGPNIFDISYTPTELNVSLEMPDQAEITCGVSDYYDIGEVYLHYTLDFWKTSVKLNGTIISSNLTGTYFHFSFPLEKVPKTYLFFFWANNSAGYFSFEDNNGNYYNLRVNEGEDEVPTDPDDPLLLKVFQKIIIGIDNSTITRNPRPDIKIWLNGTSDSWIRLNNYTSDNLTGSKFYVFSLPEDLIIGTNNLTINVFQDQLYTKNITITRLDTPLNITSKYPDENETILNYLDEIYFEINDWARINITLDGPLNATWRFEVYQKNVTIPFSFNRTYGNYSLNVSIEDYYDNSKNVFYNFTFQKSFNPFIHLLYPLNNSKIANNSAELNISFSEICNITLENLNTSDIYSFENVENDTIGGINLSTGLNLLNLTATNQDGGKNSTLIYLEQQTYIVYNFYYDAFVVPSDEFQAFVNFSTNETASGTLWYQFDYTGIYDSVNFTLYNGTLQNGLLIASIQAPVDKNHLLFNFTLYFGPEQEHYEQNGFDFHVPIDYLYQDEQGPVLRGLTFNPTNEITSNDQVLVKPTFYDVTGIKNATLIFSTLANFTLNSTYNMTYTGSDSSKNGIWSGEIPAHDNGTTIYYMIRAFDLLNNSAMFTGSYTVNDVLNTQLDNVIPGVLNPQFEKAITGAITTLLTIMVLIISVFLVVFILMNDQNVKREVYREEDRIFILRNVCKIPYSSVKKYYYIEQLTQDLIGYALGLLVGFFLLAPFFVWVVKVTLIAWTFDFQTLFYLSYITLESWVYLTLILFVLASLLLKLIQVDKYVERLAH